MRGITKGIAMKLKLNAYQITGMLMLIMVLTILSLAHIFIPN